MSHWSPSPPRSKLRHPDFGSGWPVRYAQIHSKNRKKLSTWVQLHLCISQHHPKHCQKRLLFVRPQTRFYKKLGNTMFPVNIIQTSYNTRNVRKMPECQTEQTSQTLHFQVIMPVDFGVDAKWQPKAAHSCQEEHFQLLGTSAPLHSCRQHVSEGAQSWLKPQAFARLHV